MSTLGTVVATAAAVCAGATGGVYFAFSSMVMPALHARPVTEAIHAMQRVNVMAVRLPFMIVFFGGALASAAAAVTAGTGGAPAEQAPLRLAGAVLSLASVAVTIAASVQRACPAYCRNRRHRSMADVRTDLEPGQLHTMRVVDYRCGSPDSVPDPVKQPTDGQT